MRSSPHVQPHVASQIPQDLYSISQPIRAIAPRTQKWSSEYVSPASANATNPFITSSCHKLGTCHPHPRPHPLHHSSNQMHRTARNSLPLEVLGTYNPIPQEPQEQPSSIDAIESSTTEPEVQRKFKDIKLDVSRAKYWLGVGAQPSDPAWRLLSMVCLYSCCTFGTYGKEVHEQIG